MTAIVTPIFYLPAAWLGVFGGAGILIIGGAMAGLFGGFMGANASKAVFERGETEALCVWCVAVGTSVAMGISPIVTDLLSQYLKGLSLEMDFFVVAGFAFVGAIGGSAFKT